LDNSIDYEQHCSAAQLYYYASHFCFSSIQSRIFFTVVEEALGVIPVCLSPLTQVRKTGAQIVCKNYD